MIWPQNTDQNVNVPGLEDKFSVLLSDGVRPVEESRLVYPCSVIPGGVRSKEELAAHIAADKVVSDHYTGFDVRNARIVKADKTRMMYVSYRKEDTVYWTRKKVKIPVGEVLITDGDFEARVRCGNMVSASPMDPVAYEEPDVDTFDIPKLARVILPGVLDSPFAGSGDPLTAIPQSDPPLSRNLFHPDLSPDYGTPLTALQDPNTATLPGDGASFPPAAPSLDPDMLLPEFPFESDSTYYGPISPLDTQDVVALEPATLTLLMSGLAALFTYRFLRKK